MLKKVFCIISTFAMLLTCVACNNRPEEVSSTRPAAPVINDMATTTKAVATTTETETTTAEETTTTTEESTTKATTAAKAEGTTTVASSITTSAATKKQSTSAQTQAATQSGGQKREEPARSEATQPKTTTKAPTTTVATQPTTTKATTTVTTTPATTTTVTTPATTTSETTTSTTISTTTSATTTSTTSETTTEVTTTTTEPVTEPPVTTTVYEGPLFASIENPCPEFDGLSQEWEEPSGSMDDRRHQVTVWNFSYTKSRTLQVFYIDVYMRYFGFFHDAEHIWSSQCISYVNSYGDEVKLYPDKNYISINGTDYSVSSAFGLNYDDSRQYILSNGYDFFVFDRDKMLTIAETITNNAR